MKIVKWMWHLERIFSDCLTERKERQSMTFYIHVRRDERKRKICNRKR